MTDSNIPFKTGWLWKMGAKVKSWKHRYFALTNNSFLYYYKSEKQKKNLGTVAVVSGTVAMMPENSFGRGKFMFCLAPPSGKRTYYFQAQSAKERQEWIKAFEAKGASVSERPIKEGKSNGCNLCGKSFSFVRKKKQCDDCKLAVCSSCLSRSRRPSVSADPSTAQQVRICSRCSSEARMSKLEASKTVSQSTMNEATEASDDEEQTSNSPQDIIAAIKNGTVQETDINQVLLNLTQSTSPGAQGGRENKERYEWTTEFAKLGGFLMLEQILLAAKGGDEISVSRTSRTSGSFSVLSTPAVFKNQILHIFCCILRAFPYSDIAPASLPGTLCQLLRVEDRATRKDVYELLTNLCTVMPGLVMLALKHQQPRKSGKKKDNELAFLLRDLKPTLVEHEGSLMPADRAAMMLRVLACINACVMTVQSVDERIALREKLASSGLSKHELRLKQQANQADMQAQEAMLGSKDSLATVAKQDLKQLYVKILAQLLHYAANKQADEDAKEEMQVNEATLLSLETEKKTELLLKEKAEESLKETELNLQEKQELLEQKDRELEQMRAQLQLLQEQLAATAAAATSSKRSAPSTPNSPSAQPDGSQVRADSPPGQNESHEETLEDDSQMLSQEAADMKLTDEQQDGQQLQQDEQSAVGVAGEEEEEGGEEEESSAPGGMEPQQTVAATAEEAASATPPPSPLPTAASSPQQQQEVERPAPPSSPPAVLAAGPPPPPPGSAMGGPPPPPPPPGGGPPPPPPPGGMPGMAAAVALPPPVGSGHTVEKKLKAFHWTYINSRNIENTVWKELLPMGDDKENAGEAVDWTQALDFAELGRLFEAKQGKVRMGGRGGRGGRAESVVEEEETEKVPLIDGKRSRQCEIVLKKYKLSPVVIRDALLAMDQEIITEELAKALVSCKPEDQDLKLVNMYGGDVARLGAPELYYLTISPIPRVGLRMNIFLFAHQFHKELEELEDKMALCEAATKALRHSEKFKRVLMLALAVGNYVNSGSGAKGSAYGFKLSTLDKFSFQKSQVDKSVTLLSFLVGQVHAKFPAAAGFVEELQEPMQRAARVELQAMREGVERMGTALRQVSLESDRLEQEARDRLEKQREEAEAKEARLRALEVREIAAGVTQPASPPEEEQESCAEQEKKNQTLEILKKDEFVAKMRSFLEEATPVSEGLKSRFSTVSKEAHELSEYFGEKPTDMPCELLFTLVSQFANNFKRSQDQLLARQEFDRKAKQKLDRQKLDRRASVMARPQTTNRGNHHRRMSVLPKGEAGELAPFCDDFTPVDFEATTEKTVARADALVNSFLTKFKAGKKSSIIDRMRRKKIGGKAAFSGTTESPAPKTKALHSDKSRRKSTSPSTHLHSPTISSNNKKRHKTNEGEKRNSASKSKSKSRNNNTNSPSYTKHSPNPKNSSPIFNTRYSDSRRKSKSPSGGKGKRLVAPSPAAPRRRPPPPPSKTAPPIPGGKHTPRFPANAVKHVLMRGNNENSRNLANCL